MDKTLTLKPDKETIEPAIETDQVYSDYHPGDVCLHCHEGYLDYDGLLNLVCQRCGYTLAGCST